MTDPTRPTITSDVVDVMVRCAATESLGDLPDEQVLAVLAGAAGVLAIRDQVAAIEALRDLADVLEQGHMRRLRSRQ